MKDAWLKFRSSNAFLYALLVFLAGWFILRWFYQFDADNGWLNIILSAEASVATCMILDLQFRAMKQDRETFAKILELEQRILIDVEKPDDVQ